MAKRRSLRSRRNRPRTPRVGRSIRQVSTGIPTTHKRIGGNPPPINLVSAQSVKIPFFLNIQVVEKDLPFSVKIGSNPVGTNTISLYTASLASTQTFYLDIDEIYQAAMVRVYGYTPTGTDVNYLATELALQSVTYYGPLGASSIRMGVDFGPGMPGATCTDEGTTSARPVVKASTPRLYWTKLQQIVKGDAAVGCWLEGYLPFGRSLEFKSSNVLTDSLSFKGVGRIDFTVHVRRSWYNANTAQALAAKTVVDTMMQ